MRARLIANPTSGADRAPAVLPLVNGRLRAFIDRLDITLTVDAGDAERAAAEAVDEGCDALYVAGGDGTLNAVLRGLYASGDRGCIPPIGVVPLGTGNDFAKALGLGEDVAGALSALAEPRIVTVDLGMVNGRPFANTSAGGFVADVSDTVTERLKDVTGKLAYIIGGARVLFGTEPFAGRLIVHDEAHRHRVPGHAIDLQMFAVCNARFIGGGYPIAPDALIDDGLLDVLAVARMPVVEFLAVLQRIASGRYEDAPGVSHFRAAAFDFEFSRAVRVNTDGEVLEANRCEYRVLPGGARFFCGAAPQTRALPVPWRPGSRLGAA
jgi:diacylglycerol kinase (ATP)